MSLGARARSSPAAECESPPPRIFDISKNHQESINPSMDPSSLCPSARARPCHKFYDEHAVRAV